WDHVPQPDGTTAAVPNRRANAGFGWLLTFGLLIDPSDSTNVTNDRRFVYVSPDGGEHGFYPTLHPGETAYACNPTCPVPGVLSVSYTRDNTYMRMRQTGANRREIDMPDGTTHVFNTTGAPPIVWTLDEIRDRYRSGGTAVNFLRRNTSPPALATAGCAAADTRAEGFTDSMGRTQYLCLRSLTIDGASREVVTSVRTTAFGGARSVVTLGYEQEEVKRGCFNTAPNSPAAVVQSLRTVTLPDGSSYRATYYLSDTPPSSSCVQGSMEKLTFPTLGSVRWTYGIWSFPPSGFCIDYPAYLDTTPGVRERTLLDETGATVGLWTYRSVLSEPVAHRQPLPCEDVAVEPGPSEELQTILTTPDKDQVIHYFSVWPRSTPAPNGTSRLDYALPFTRFRAPGAWTAARRDGIAAEGQDSLYVPQFLSTATYDCDGQGTNCTLLRTTDVRYERDAGPAQYDANRRPAHSTTSYHDDKDSSNQPRWTETGGVDFDGLGHYRMNTTTGNFADTVSESRADVVNYNPARGSYNVDFWGGVSGGFTPPPVDGPWLLSLFTYSERWGATSAVLERQEHDFDPDTGFLRRRRVLAGRTQGPHDLLTVFTADGSGRVAREEQFGGDTQTVASGDLATLPVPSHGAGSYRIDHEHPSFQSGVYSAARKSQFVDPSNNAVLATITDADIDQSTGLVSITRDGAGLAATHVYDTSGRLTSSTPQAGHDGSTSYTYAAASNANGVFARATATVKQHPNGNALQTLTETI
ncbi:MAG TPA: hypothetical protein VJ831_01595, partial [Jatrophihabitantaceae bacterium]|nr:hypothetical protein [Jatrophihabitantaceae bacterium]